MTAFELGFKAEFEKLATSEARVLKVILDTASVPMRPTITGAFGRSMQTMREILQNAKEMGAPAKKLNQARAAFLRSYVAPIRLHERMRKAGLPTTHSEALVEKSRALHMDRAKRHITTSLANRLGYN